MEDIMDPRRGIQPVGMRPNFLKNSKLSMLCVKLLARMVYLDITQVKPDLITNFILRGGVPMSVSIFLVFLLSRG